MDLSSTGRKIAVLAAGVIAGGILAGALGAQAASSTPSPSTADGSAAGSGQDLHHGDNGADHVPQSQEHHGFGRLDLSGTVTAVGPSGVTIKTSSGAATYAVTSSSDIDKNGEAALSDLAAGDAVRFSVTVGRAAQIDKPHAGSEALDRPQGMPGAEGSHHRGARRHRVRAADRSAQYQLAAARARRPFTASSPGSLPAQASSAASVEVDEVAAGRSAPLQVR